MSLRIRFRKTTVRVYNIAPTQPRSIVTSKYEQRRAANTCSGLANAWARDNSWAAVCINAKADTIDTRGAFRDAFAHQRCVFRAHGFYKRTGPKPARRPMRFHREDGGLILFAGIVVSEKESTADDLHDHNVRAERGGCTHTIGCP